jgi:hypothetical protein
MINELMTCNFNQPVTLEEKIALREKIFKFENFLLSIDGLKIEPIHSFAKGIYARQILIPKGTFVTGFIHKHEGLNIVSYGKMSVVSDEGFYIVEGPCTMVSKSGIKKAGYAIEDTLWTTIHATDETDIEKLEQELFTNKIDDLEFCKLSESSQKVG